MNCSFYFNFIRQFSFLRRSRLIKSRLSNSDVVISNRLRGLGSAEGQSLTFPIDFDGRPYNTLTLPCERVIGCILSCTPTSSGLVILIFDLLTNTCDIFTGKADSISL